MNAKTKKNNAQLIKFTAQFTINRVAQFISGQFDSKEDAEKHVQHGVVMLIDALVELCGKDIAAGFLEGVIDDVKNGDRLFKKQTRH